MSGASGPTVTLHRPAASFAIGWAGRCRSPCTATDSALGARIRNVTRPSGSTSGETTGGGCCAQASPDPRMQARATAGIRRQCRWRRGLRAGFIAGLWPRSPPAKLALRGIAWPIFVEQTLRMLIGTVDTFMVSHVSDGAVAALGVANQVIIFFLVAFNFIGIGTSVVITHHLGARDRAGADKIATNAIAVNTWLGAAFSASVYFFALGMLRAMQLPGALMDYALPFLTLMGGTLFMESMNISIVAVLRAHGHTRDAMLVTLGQNVLN